MTPPYTVTGIAYPRELDAGETRLAASLQDTLEGLSYLTLCHLALAVPRLRAQVRVEQEDEHDASWQVALRWALFTDGDIAKPRFREFEDGSAHGALEQLRRALNPPRGFSQILRNEPLQYTLAIEKVILLMHRRWRLQASLAERTSMLRYLYCDALLRSCMYAVSLPGLAMALIPVALLCYDTLHQFCVTSGIDHSQLHRMESGMVSISLPRLRRIVETLHSRRMRDALHIVFVPSPDVYERFYSGPFAPPKYFRPTASPGTYGLLEATAGHWWSLLEARPLGIDGLGRIDVDHFRDAVLSWHRDGNYRYSASAEILQCDRSYLSRVLRGESAGSVELFGTMAWALGNGRLMIQAEQRPLAAETPKELVRLAQPPGAARQEGELNATQRR